MTSLLHYLATIQARPQDQFEAPPDTQLFLAAYLERRGYQLAAITSHAELLRILRECNAADFDCLAQKPTPAASLRFLWNRLSKLGR